MALERWSNDIVLARLNNGPQFADDIAALEEQAETWGSVVLDLSAVSYINSTHLARLLQLRKVVHAAQSKLILCGVSAQVRGVLDVTGLDKVFEISENVATALATLQMKQP